MTRFAAHAGRYVLLLLCFGFFYAVQAAPQINLVEHFEQGRKQQTNANLEIDLRQRWEKALIGQVIEAENTPIDPSLIWAWPAERFSSKPDSKPFLLRSGQRMITRWTVFNEKSDADFLVTVLMPRLDAVHLSYRIDFGPWKTLSAGDRIAMNDWPLADRQPSFDVNMPIGQVDMVMQFAHRGPVDAPTYLQNHRAFLDARANTVLLVGIAVGINLVLALMAIMMTLNFRKLAFLAVFIMSMMVSLVLLFGSGLGGMFVGEQLSEFNDQAKYWIQTSWGLLLLVIAALALGIQFHSKSWWWATLLLTLLGVCVIALTSNYERREVYLVYGAICCGVLMLFLLAMLSWAWLKNFSRNYTIYAGLLVYTSAVLILFIAHTGLYSVTTGSMWAAFLSMLASLALMRGLFMQHRMGRQVQARANISPLRDVLTGLLNREGMQAHVYKARERMRSEQICALFIYIPVQDANVAMEEVGEQGFEAGMVQIAASLATNVSGMDGVGRISRHAFGICVMMEPDPAQATRLAQKILSRVMMLATQSTPLCSTVRLSMAWLPVNSFRIDSLERRCLEALQTLEPGKRIAWVGGPQSHREAAQMQRSMNTAPTDPSADTVAEPRISSQMPESTTLYERIHRIEREMLGTDTIFLQEEAERMSRELNEAREQEERAKSKIFKRNPEPEDFEPTQQIRTG